MAELAERCDKMAQLPADRTKLALAQSNQVPSAVASSQRNKDAITEAYDTIDMLHGFTQTQLGLKYSKAETDALLLANKTGDHAGTWQGYTPSQVSASIVQQNLDALKADVAQRGINIKYPPPPLVAAKVDGVTDDTSTINAIINALPNGGIVFIPEGTCIINGNVDLKTGIHLMGAGKSVAIVKRTVAGDILHILGTTTKRNIVISGITFDMNNQTASSGLIAEYVENLSIINCQFKNHPSWGVNIGVLSNTDAVIRNKNILIWCCDFDNNTSTYEEILVFNAENVTIQKCSFTNSPNGNAIGLYQQLDNVTIEDNYFKSNQQGIYYSLTTNNIHIRRNRFITNTTAIQGANQSDNGALGATRAYNINAEDNHFEDNVIALQLGAVVGANIDGNMFYRNRENCIVISAGNSPVNGQSNTISISNNKFRNNNTSATASSLHPGIFFTGAGGSMYCKMDNNDFWDDQGAPTQLYPIVFQGAFTYAEVTIMNSRLSAYSGGLSVGVSDGALIGANVRVIYCLNVGSVAAGVTVI